MSWYKLQGDIRYVIQFLCKTDVEEIIVNSVQQGSNIVRVIKSRRKRWAGHVAHMGKRRGVYRVLVEKPEGKRPLGRPRHRMGG